jgi:hypothetical protein
MCWFEVTQRDDTSCAVVKWAFVNEGTFTPNWLSELRKMGFCIRNRGRQAGMSLTNRYILIAGVHLEVLIKTFSPHFPRSTKPS